MQFNNFPSCCTALVLTGLGSGSDAPIDSVVNDLLRSASRLNPNLDFALLTAVTTSRQTSGAKALETIGFRKAETGGKDGTRNRHKETGALTLWSFTPSEFAAWQKEYIIASRPKKELQIGSLAIKGRQAQFPEFTYTHFKNLMIEKYRRDNGYFYLNDRHFIYYQSYVEGNTAVSETITITALSEILRENYGYSPTTWVEERRNIDWARVKEILNDWRNGYIA